MIKTWETYAKETSPVIDGFFRFAASKMLGTTNIFPKWSEFFHGDLLG